MTTTVEQGGKTTKVINLVPGVSFVAGGPPAPLEDFAAMCVGIACARIGVDLGLERVTLQPDDLGSNFTCNDREATIFIRRSADAYQQYFQAGRAIFRAVAARELGGMHVIPGRALHPEARRDGRAGLWPHEMLALLFQVEMLYPDQIETRDTDPWAPPLHWYRTVSEWAYNRDDRSFSGILYQLGVDLQAAVGVDALFKLGHPKYVRDRWFVEYERWLTTLPNAAANDVVSILERHYRQWIGAKAA